MMEMALTEAIIRDAERTSIEEITPVMAQDLAQMILYGSCARGDFRDDSDIDIALLLRCDREEAKKYAAKLAEIATEFAMRYFTVVNYICLPLDEFSEKKSWYPFFMNIQREGKVIYG